MNKTPAVVWRLDHLLHTDAIALGTNAVVVAGQKSAAAGQTMAADGKYTFRLPQGRCDPDGS